MLSADDFYQKIYEGFCTNYKDWIDFADAYAAYCLSVSK